MVGAPRASESRYAGDTSVSDEQPTTSSAPPELGAERATLWFALAPLLVMVLSHATFELTALDLPSLIESLATQLEADRELRAARPFAEARVRLQWSGALLLFYAATLSLLGYSIVLLRRPMSNAARRLHLGAAAVLCLLSLAHAAYSGATRNTFSSIYYFTYESLQHCACYTQAELADIDLAVTALNVMAALILPLGLIAALSVMARPGLAGKAALGAIEVQMRRLKMVLNLGSTLLFTGILHQVLWLRWPAVLVSDATIGQDVTGFAEGLSVYWGASYSLLLLAFFMPSAWSLNERARSIIEDHPGIIGDMLPGDWLEKHGLSVSPGRQLPQIVAMLGPLLAGPLGSTLSGLATAPGVG
jgi:hypothetical protein